MDCQYIWNNNFRRTPLQRLFSVYGIVSVYIFENIMPNVVPREEQYDFWQIFYLREGALRCTFEDGAEYHVVAGQALFRPAGKVSSIEYDPDTVNDVVIVSFECASPALDFFARPPLTLFGDEAATLNDLVNTGVRIFEPLISGSREKGLRLKPDASSAVLSYVGTSLERFLSMLYCRVANAKYYLDESEKINKHIRDTQLVAEIKLYLKAHLNGKLTLEELSARFGVNQITMMKLFKRETASSIIDYHIELKVKEAMRMISETSYNFSEIADYLGFTSANYFSRVFKERTGCTPTEFARKQSKVMLTPND